MSAPILQNGVVYRISRCPQCGVATPLISQVGSAYLHAEGSGPYGRDRWYFTGVCSRCQNHMLFYGEANTKPERGTDQPAQIFVTKTFPNLETVADELPERAANFFQQAIESKHAPDGALMLAASAIDAMLKDNGYRDGSLFARIQQASNDGLLTNEMAGWAHEIRLSANEPRHADDEFTSASSEDAEQIIQFARALGEYLYVLPARVKKWATKAEPPN